MEGGPIVTDCAGNSTCMDAAPLKQFVYVNKLAMEIVHSGYSTSEDRQFMGSKTELDAKLRSATRVRTK